ncbi:MAG: hypothetical protein COA78_14710 [Blastopirellula sp.]|nr:MAG: hypothetical protein COA78_14710 [Blastopirellula sp.]
MRLCISLISFSLLGITVSSGLAAEDLQGADAVLKVFTEKPKPEKAAKSLQEVFQEKQADFQKKIGKMKDAEAADAWLSLLDQAFMFDSYNVPSVSLPPPRTWKNVSQKLEQREPPEGKQLIRLQLVQIMFKILQDDFDASKSILEKMLPQLEKLDPYELQNIAQHISEINQYLNARNGDQETLIQDFEEQLTQLELAAEERSYKKYVEVPDLVGIAGKPKAEALLRRLLVIKKLDLTFEGGEATIELSKKLALELVKEMPQPIWILVNSIDSGELYEAYVQQFVETKQDDQDEAVKPDDSELNLDKLRLLIDQTGFDRFSRTQDQGMSYAQSRALSYYLIGLIHQGKNKKARDLILESPESGIQLSSIISNMRRARLLQSVFSFVDELLEERPDLNLWSDYITLAVELNQTEAMVAKIKKAANDPKLDTLQAFELKNHLMNAYLAADKIDAAYAIWKTARAIVEKKSHSNEEIEFISDNLADTTWFEIGDLLNRPELMREAEQLFSSIRAILGKNPDSQGFYNLRSLESRLIESLIKQKRYVQAEALLLKQLAVILNPSSKNYSGSVDGTLYQLVGIYYETERYTDVLALVDQIKEWDQLDVKEMKPAPAMQIATALAITGKKEDALRIVEYHLKHTSYANDPMYALYVELHSDPIPLLDELYKRDQFEERPLIWKGHALAQKGQLKEAEAIINQAISLDPSDGEQGKGDRMRVYAVLREIKLKQNDAEQADFLEGILLAIRMSEHADDFARVGLQTRAITMYKNSLNHFADAYCIQSRLAIRLNEEGKFEEAEKYYQKAYELMPDSFGRVESHCFGCEGIFSSSQAQNIAERVFSRLLKERPDKPQVHYLLGYLRTNQHKPEEAYKLFERAVELDDNYINAWLKLLSLRSKVHIAPEKLNNIGLKLIELDPLNRNRSLSGLEMISDFKGLWNVLEKSYALSWDNPDEVYLLKAVKKQRDLVKQDYGQNNSHDGYGDPFGGYEYRRNNQAPIYPGDAMLRHPVIQNIYQVINR